MKKMIVILLLSFAASAFAAWTIPRALALPAPSASTARIARVWHGQTLARRGDEYGKYLFEQGVRKLRGTPGNLGAQMLRRNAGDRTEFVVISYWPSEEAIRAWAGETLTKTRPLPRDPEFLIDPETEVRHFTIEADER